MIEEINSKVDKLASLCMRNVFNPYSDICEVYDKPNADDIRKENLKKAIDAALKLKTRTMWVGRDLGYRGGRRTGLALTDEMHLDAHAKILGGIKFHRATNGPIMKERTASIIWQIAHRINQPIFMWNAFPFHPHLPEDPMSNRKHDATELKSTEFFTLFLLDLLNPESILCIGADSHKYLSSIGIDSKLIRHPSYGGKSKFIKQIEVHYNLESMLSDKNTEDNVFDFG